MKKLYIFLIFLVGISLPNYAIQNYSAGNFLLGIGLGAGTASAYPLGDPQFTIHPSVEFIVAAWNPKKLGYAMGITIDSSVNIGGGVIGTIAPMATFHLTLLPRFDWYTSLGIGLQLHKATGTSGRYTIHVGYTTGFNIMVNPAWFWNIGLAIHADQFFGSTGVKIRFGNVDNVQY